MGCHTPTTPLANYLPLPKTMLKIVIREEHGLVFLRSRTRKDVLIIGNWELKQGRTAARGRRSTQSLKFRMFESSRA